MKHVDCLIKDFIIRNKKIKNILPAKNHAKLNTNKNVNGNSKSNMINNLSLNVLRTKKRNIVYVRNMPVNTSIIHVQLPLTINQIGIKLFILH